MNIFIDLFSGTGGASQAFDKSPNWMTFKIDNNVELLEHNRNLMILDLSRTNEVIRIIESYLAEIDYDKLIIWASPPCQQFSYANPDRNEDEFDLTLLDSAYMIIDYFQPDYWIIENVLGAIETFTDELNCSPTQKIGSIILWGDFPLIAIDDRASFRHIKMNAKGTRTLRSTWRARIPYQVSAGLLAAVTNQLTLKEWMQVEEIEEE